MIQYEDDNPGFWLAILIIIMTAVWAAAHAETCAWQRCGMKDGRPINCQPIEKGSSEAVAQVIKQTQAGAVVFECAPNENQIRMLKR